jgi:sporulation protein YlmC with PRC-barrel domain
VVGAYAQETAAPVTLAEGNLASQIIGENVYNGTGDDAEKIGDVNDIVLSKDGQVQSLVIGVGGFLGIGEKSVTFDYGKAQWATKGDDRWLVVQGSKEELMALPAFDRKAYELPASTAATPDPAAPVTTTDTATAPADNSGSMASDKSSLTEVPMGNIRSEDLVGTTVYGADDVKVGEIGDIALAADQKIDAVIVDVGGFLGMGEKEVALGMDNLKVMADKDGKKYLYTPFTKDQFEKQAAYDKGSYGEKRDEQRLILQ